MSSLALAALPLVALAAAVHAPAGASAKLLPSRSACPAQQNPKADERKQEDAMHCLLDGVRKRDGARKLRSHRALEKAAGSKVRDVSRCGFSHTACGRPADAYAREYGYMRGTSGWQWAENLAIGGGRRGSARQVAKAWLASPGHRANILRRSFEHLGIGLRRDDGTAVWVLQLGCRGC